MKRLTISLFIFTGMLLVIPTHAWGQVKIGYIQSERIRQEYDEFKDAESQLQMEFRKVQFEYTNMISKLDSMKQEFETQRLMSSPEWRREKEQSIANMEQSIQSFQALKVGPEGELYNQQAQLEYDILSKVKKAVDKVAIDGGYDFIIDASIGLLYYKSKYDLTDDVLHELRKDSSDN